VLSARISVARFTEAFARAPELLQGLPKRTAGSAMAKAQQARHLPTSGSTLSRWRTQMMPASTGAASALTAILAQLTEDHNRVKKAYRAFVKLAPATDPQAVQAIVKQVCKDLRVHAAIEEELLYPAARSAIEDVELIDEAEVEHEFMHTAIKQLRGMSPGDDKYAARFTVLCEYVLHHVKEEEGEIFPQLQQTSLDWETMAVDIAKRRTELICADGGDSDEEAGLEFAEDESADPVGNAPTY